MSKPTGQSRWQRYTVFQRTLLIVCLLLVTHFLFGSGLWLLFVYVQTTVVFRNARPGKFWWELFNWLPFYSRSWKSTAPLCISLLSLYLIEFRPKLALKLICGVILFSAAWAYYDISSRDFDMVFFGPNGERAIYFTWWWWQQRPR